MVMNVIVYIKSAYVNKAHLLFFLLFNLLFIFLFIKIKMSTGLYLKPQSKSALKINRGECHNKVLKL